MKKLFLILISVLLVSGCTYLPFDIPFLDSGGPNVTKLGPDVIVIQNINVIPSTSIRPSDSFSVYYEVKNQDENEMISDVKYHLYDTGLCKFQPLEGGDDPTSLTTLGDFAPSETKLVEWNFQAPSADDIAHLRLNCPIKFKVNYPYQARSQIDVVVIDEDRLRDLQRAGEDVIHIPTLSMGRGPIKIYFDFGNTLPVRENSNLSVYVKVKNEGVGSFGEIPTEGKTLNIHTDCNLIISCLDDYFACTGTLCVNILKPIPLINKETFEIRCLLQVPPGMDIEMEKTFYIYAELDYDYDVLGEVNVGVNP